MPDGRLLICMATARRARVYPVGTGWLIGFLLGAVFGALGYLVSGRLAMGLILFAATGTSLGYTFEQSVRGRPMTALERWLTWLLVVTGLVVLGLVLLSQTVL
jgi:hypothetical protein